MYSDNSNSKKNIMTKEDLQKGVDLNIKIVESKKRFKEMEYVLNCLSHENCKSVEIQIFALSENAKPINDQYTKHQVETGNVISIIKESIEVLSSKIEEMEFSFKNL